MIVIKKKYLGDSWKKKVNGIFSSRSTYMFSHGLKIDDASCAVVSNDWRWHVQHFWNWRVKFPNEIDVSGNALHLALYLSCFTTTYVVCLNLSRATDGGNWTRWEENNVGCNHVKTFCFLHNCAYIGFLATPDYFRLHLLSCYRCMCSDPSATF